MSALTRISSGSSPESLGQLWAGVLGSTAMANATWPVTDKAIFVPFRINESRTATRLWLVNGTVLTNNVDLGLYDTSGTRLVSTGDTARVGASSRFSVGISSTVIPAGVFYFGIVLHGTTGTVNRVAPTNVGQARAYGCLNMAAAWPLPSSATFAAVTDLYIPHVGVDF